MSLNLYQVIIINKEDHYSKFVAARNENEARELVQKKLVEGEQIHFIRKVENVIGKDRDYKIELK